MIKIKNTLGCGEIIAKILYIYISKLYILTSINKISKISKNIN